MSDKLDDFNAWVTRDFHALDLIYELYEEEELDIKTLSDIQRLRKCTFI